MYRHIPQPEVTYDDLVAISWREYWNTEYGKKEILLSGDTDLKQRLCHDALNVISTVAFV